MAEMDILVTHDRGKLQTPHNNRNSSRWAI